jgi:predicted enzyme related to lactoylglutathione lyase
MTEPLALRGFANISLFAADHEAAKKWYSELLGIEPYFGMPGYCEWRLGDSLDEMGLIDAKYAPKGAKPGPGGVIMSWHVDDLDASIERLKAAGATEYEPKTPRGDTGFVTASFVDPFGNVIGVMYNPHYVEVMGGKKDAWRKEMKKPRPKGRGFARSFPRNG